MTLPAQLPPAVAAHLGTLHAYETVLVLVIAFGPFLVIAALLVRERRRDAAAGQSGADRDAHDQDHAEDEVQAQDQDAARRSDPA